MKQQVLFFVSYELVYKYLKFLTELSVKSWSPVDVSCVVIKYYKLNVSS